MLTKNEKRRVDIERKFMNLYNAEDREARVLLLPLLGPMQLEQLTALQKPVWDGYVISKVVRDELWDLGLIDRWNGWQLVNIYGLAVLETLGLIMEKNS